jgi:predicted enzyme involved in methoxymalonyl-ACP biosynthesis
VFSASYQDKFGPLGKIAVVKGRVTDDTVFVDTWVMSCRAFARRIEHQCLGLLFERFGAARVEFDYVQTARNEPVQQFLAGFLRGAPNGTPAIDDASFRSACPPLYHTVRTIDD